MTLAVLPIREQVSPEEWDTRVQLAAAYRGLALEGVTDYTYNHLSARVPGQPDRVVVKAEHQLFQEVTASSLVTYSLQGEKLIGEGSLSRGGLVIHLGVLQARPDLQAVFHTHTPANMAVSAQRFGLLNITQHAVRFHGRIGYHDFGGFEFDVEGRQALVAALEGRQIAILRNHGVLVGGTTIPEAFVKHYFLEVSCRAQVAALSAGLDQLLVIDDAVAERAARQSEAKPRPDTTHRDWQALLRQLAVHGPDYQN